MTRLTCTHIPLFIQVHPASNSLEVESMPVLSASRDTYSMVASKQGTHCLVLYGTLKSAYPVDESTTQHLQAEVLTAFYLVSFALRTVSHGLSKLLFLLFHSQQISDNAPLALSVWARPH